jgi:hypothetical protein
LYYAMDCYSNLPIAHKNPLFEGFYSSVRYKWYAILKIVRPLLAPYMLGFLRNAQANQVLAVFFYHAG